MPVIRFIEPAFVESNPSTNSLVPLVSELVDLGFEIEIWTRKIDPKLGDRVQSIRLIPWRFSIPLVEVFWDSFVIHGMAIRDYWIGREKPVLTICNGFIYLPADISLAHYSHFDALVKMVGRKFYRDSEGWFEFAKSIPGLLTEVLYFYNPWKTHLVPVSDAVAADFKKWAAPWKEIDVIPNRWHADRFSVQKRQENRQLARKEHGFKEQEVVFVFLSAGHYYRKGFAQAVRVTGALRDRGFSVRMLVIGGRKQTLARQSRIVGKQRPDFCEWTVFTGMVDNPEYHLAAGDGFLFPSMAEAFSLAEIEAASMGIPLFLTPHHGSEMILRDGENGRLLPWDDLGMTGVLEEELRRGLRFSEQPQVGKAMSASQHLEAWQDLMVETIREKTGDTSSQWRVQSALSEEASRKPRLLLVGHTYMISVNREKAKALAEWFEVCVCTADHDDWNVLGAPIHDEEDPRHEGCYELKRLRRYPRTTKYTAFGLKGLGEEIRLFKPDFILVENEPWSMLRWQCWWFAKIYAREAKFVEFTWENVERPGWKGMLLKWVYRAAALTGDLAICGNRAAAGLMRKAGFADACLIVDGQLGVRQADFPTATKEAREHWRQELGWGKDMVILGFCGRLVEEKGLQDLVEAVQMLRSEGHRLGLAVMGDGPLREWLGKLDPNHEWIVMFPSVPHKMVVEFVNKLDLFVLPSRPLRSRQLCWEEQFGHVLIEAITAGVVTLGSNSGAIPEVIGDPQFVFPHSDPHQLSLKIREYLDFESRSAALQKQGPDCASRWSHEAIASRYARFLLGKG